MTQKALMDRWRDEPPLEGWKRAGPDHPIYSEGPSITFLRRTPKQSQQKDIVFPQTDLNCCQFRSTTKESFL